MAITADPTVQRRLLVLAEVDRAIAAAGHRRRTLPELAVIEASAARMGELGEARVLAEADLADLDRAARKLDGEIDQVRTRAERDGARLAAGTGAVKDLENLQHEIESLARRQSVLEDEALELMERRETAEAGLADLRLSLAQATGEHESASRVRDVEFGAIDAELAELGSRRGALIGEMPGDVAALYERIHGGGKVAAAELSGSRCGACRMDLDRVSLDEIRSAAADLVVRCPECGAILLRT